MGTVALPPTHNKRHTRPTKKEDKLVNTNECRHNLEVRKSNDGYYVIIDAKRKERKTDGMIL